MDELTKGTTRRRYRKYLMWCIKLLVTSALCIWLIGNVEWNAFWRDLQSLPPSGLLIPVVLAISCVLVSAWKWQILLRMHGVSFPYSQLAKWYFTGSFIGVFLPTNIGGDAYRIYRTYNNSRGRITSILAVLVERISGLLALLFMGYVAAIISWYISGNVLSYFVAVVGTIGIPVGIVVLILFIKFDLVNKLSQRINSYKFLGNLIAHGGDYLRQPRDVVYVIILSFIFHIMRICGLLFLLYLFDANFSVFDVFVVASLTTLLGMMPISIGGFGVIEGSFTYLMSLFGLPMEIGLSTILISRISGILVALPGAVFYLWEREAPIKRTPGLTSENSSDSVASKP